MKARVIQIEIKFGGNELAKVLHYYGFSPDEEKIVCPFHGDINPSMKIDYSTGTYFCFGCGEAGNAFNFVQKAEKIDDDLSACKKYIKILRSKKVRKIQAREIVKTKADNKQKLIEAEDYYYCLKTIDWKHDKCDEVEETRLYMNNRGFNTNTLNKCKAKVTYNKSYPIVFPMFDNETFKGWVCRTNKQTIEKKRKYLYNEGFSRRTTLCGTHKSKILVVVEGYMDMLKFKQFGVKNVVALLGWKITAQQMQSLKDDGVELIISALDADKCGKQGTKYLQQFFNVVKFQYPDGIKDAGEMDIKTFKLAQAKTKKLVEKWRKENGISR